MKQRLLWLAAALIVHLTAWAQINGGGYNPSNPGDPYAPDTTKRYSVTVSARPTNGGSYSGTGAFVEGQQVSLRASANGNYYFTAWLSDEGDTLSTSWNYVFTMPAHSVHVVCAFRYSPGSPSDPEAPDTTRRYNLELRTEPSGAGSFNMGSGSYAHGGSFSLYAYANNNYSLKEILVGDSLVRGTNRVDFVMPEHPLTITARYAYNPSNPGEPQRNEWNAETGEVIVDDFTPGNLSSAIYSVISNSSAVNTIIVAGRINSNDFGISNSYGNCSVLDLSRVAGVTEVPSWAFDNTNLSSVLLPSTIESIGRYAFSGCKQLASVTAYAMTPPALGYRVFDGVPEGLVAYVPAAAMPAYQQADGWKELTLLPIQNDIRSLTVALPEGADVNAFTGMWLELTNANSGQRMHYVLTDRTAYSFRNLIKNTLWNVCLRNQRGDVFGRIDNVAVKDSDVSVSFTALTVPQNVALHLTLPDGRDVTSQVQATWTDSKGNYLAQDTRLTGLGTGTQLQCRVALPQALAMAYQTPDVLTMTVNDSVNVLTAALQPLRQVMLQGRVKDKRTGMALSGATVSLSQTFAGKYSRTLSTSTADDGTWKLTAYEVPTSMAVSAADYVSLTMVCDSLMNGGDMVTMPDVALQTIAGVVINLGFTYTECPEGDEAAETQNWYSDYKNVDYTVYDRTKGRQIRQLSVQYPQIVLLEEVADGDELVLTATSRSNAFTPVQATAVVDSMTASATFNVVELGRIKATFAKNENARVTGTLYGADGKLLKTTDYTDGKLTLSDLPDGQYTLVTMAANDMLNAIGDLRQYEAAGLTAADYVSNTVTVESGRVSHVSIQQVPTLDASRFSYTGSRTALTVNKSDIVVGNFLTLTGNVDFKPVYSGKVSNVSLVIDLPDNCSFVNRSVMVGSGLPDYSLSGQRITIPMARFTDRVRFCVVPTLGGDYRLSGMVQFDLDGKTITQSIGAASYTAKNLSIDIPATTTTASVTVGGTAQGRSAIEVYDKDVLIGQTTALASGEWSAQVDLDNPYNLSTHSIYAKATTKEGLSLMSETKDCLLDKNMIEAKAISMIFWNGWLRKNVEVNWDFETKTVSPSSYMYYGAPDCTFMVDFSNNDTTLVSDVVLNVYTDKKEVVRIPADYDEATNKWIAKKQFTTDNLPVNVSVDFVSNTAVEIDTIETNKFRNNLRAQMDSSYNAEAKYEATIAQIDEEMAKENADKEKVDSLIDEAIKIHLGFIKKFDDGLPKDDRTNYDPAQDPVIKQIQSSTSDEQIIDIVRNLNKTIDEDKLKAALEYLTPKSSDLNQTIEPRLIKGEYTPKITLDCPSVLNGDGRFSLPEGTWVINDQYSEDHPQEIRLENRAGDKITYDYSLQIENHGLQHADVSNPYIWKILGETTRTILEDISTSKDIAEVLVKGLEVRLEYLEALKKTSSAAAWDVVRREANVLKVGPQLKNFKEGISGYDKFGLFMTGVSGIFAAIDAYDAFGAYKDWDNVIKKVKESCSASATKAIVDDAETYKKWIGRRKAWNAVASTGNFMIGLGSAIAEGVTLGASTVLLGFSIGSGKFLEYMNQKYAREDELHLRDIVSRVNSNPECGSIDFGTGIPPALFKSLTPIHDPSGFVYEGVPSNRLEGVTATIFYKENVEDMYGDLHENVVKWDAEEYAQQNPLFTDENGMYRWDVPEGLWQVRFEKQGYENTASEWLPVPPPQLDVNIAMRQNAQPNVVAARAYEDAVEVEFDKYMQPEYLTADQIAVRIGDKTVKGSIALLDTETDSLGNGHSYARKVRFNAAAPFDTTEVALSISNRVRSYAGIRMQNDYEQTFKVKQEVRRIDCDSLKLVAYGDTAYFTVRVVPAVAAAGKTLRVSSSSPIMASVLADEVTIDENGEAEIGLCGNLPGAAGVTFTVDSTDVSALMLVNVRTHDLMVVAVPKASIASGSTIDAGTAITLTCATEGATIWYTTDGSCPCEEAGTRLRYDGTPIVLTASTTLKVIAEAKDMYDSEVATFTYEIVSTGIEQLHLDAYSRVTVYDTSGKAIRHKASLKDIQRLPQGVYIVNGQQLIVR